MSETLSAGPAGIPADAAGFFVVRQYLVDLSIESPFGRLPDAHIPYIQLEAGAQVNAASTEDSQVFFVDLLMRLDAKVDSRAVFVAELKYRTEVRLQHVAQDEVPHVLYVGVPETAIGTVQEIFAANFRYAGYPELQLKGVDFAALFAARLEEVAAAGAQH